MRKEWLLLALIIFLGGAVRFADLAHNPPELFADEIDSYVSAKSIVMTGHDIDGSLKPFLYARLMRNAPMYAIASYLSSLVLGNGPFGLRFPAALFGVCVIFLVYAITKELTRREDTSLFASLLVAVQPLFIHFSRVAWEPASTLPFLLGGLYVLLRELRFAREHTKTRFGFLALAAFLLGMTTYTYAAGWFYVIILGGSLILFSRSLFRAAEESQKLIAAFTIWAAISAPGFWVLFTDPGTSDRMFLLFNHASHVQGFISLYIAHFSWPYLIATGDGPNPRVQRELGGFGALYWWMIPLLAAGTINIIRYVPLTSMRLWVFLWLAAYPLGGTIASSYFPNAGRTLPGAPILCIIAALGLTALLDYGDMFSSSGKKRAYIFALQGASIVNFAVSFIWFCTFYFGTYPRLTAPGWDSGNGAAFETVRANAKGFSRFCLNGFNYYSISGYADYYLEGLPLVKFENADDPACYLPGTFLITLGNTPISRLGFTTIYTALSVDNSVYALVEARNPQ